MKQLFATLIGFLLYHSILFAQIPNCDAPVPYNRQAYDMLKNLDKTQIPTGVLYENVYPWAELEFYDGSATSDTSNTSHFMQAYSEMYNSTFNRVNLSHPSDLMTNIINFHADKTFHHPVGIIDYQFNTIKEDAVGNNLLSVSNSQLFDVSGRTESPYLSKQVAIAVPLLAEGVDVLYEGTHYLHFNSNFVLSNTGFNLNNVQNIKIYLDGVEVVNQNVTGLENVVIPIDITGTIQPINPIPIVLTLVITTTVVKYFFDIFKKDKKFNYTICDGATSIIVTGNEFGADYGRANYGAKGRGYIFYGNGHCNTLSIRKPIIFVDGFDPTNKQHAGEIWLKYLNNPYRDANNNLKSLGDSLRSRGYDLIIFDQEDTGTNKGGAGLVENNGLALVKFLQTLYANYGSMLEEDIIVIGASMGGLVTRYALSYMEQNNLPHHVKLFISFDSPQAGAQIPVGVQQFADVITQYGGLKILFPDIVNAIHNSDAAKQMLVHHSSTNSETLQAHPFRTKFLNNLTAVGNWPTQCRMISITDGNRNGVLKSTPPIPNPDANGNTSVDACEKELDFGIKKRLLAFCNNDFCYKTNSKTFAQTSSSRCKSLDFFVNNNTSLLKLIFGGGHFTEISYFTQTGNGTSHDIAPGARFKDPFEDQLTPWVYIYSAIVSGNLSVTKNIVQSTNFIPTTSSVAYTFPNNEPFNVYKDFTGVNLSKCAGTTPFDTVYAPNTDLNHVRINNQLATWFYDEVFNSKTKSTCSDPNCPEYITLNSIVPNGSRLLKKAQKAIFIEQGFKADGIDESVIFKAAIGCNQVLSPQQLLPNAVNSCSQPFEFDQPRNYKTCDGTTTTFHVFVHNIDINTYAEYSIDGTNYFKANILDDGYEITLPNDTNPQVFFARSADNRSNIIGGYLAYCN